MKEIWLKIAPGGYLLLNVPLNAEDSFFWYSTRHYGPSRFPILIRGWEYVGLATKYKIYGPKHDFFLQDVYSESPVIILQKPESVDLDDVLDITKFGGLT